MKARLSGLPRAGARQLPSLAGAARKGARLKPRSAGITAEPLGVEIYLPGQVRENEHGPHFVHTRGRSEMDKGTAQFLRRMQRVGQRALKLDVHEELAGLLSAGLERTVFLDLETTGLSQCPVFLVGVMLPGPTDWELRQYFARDYAEERAIVRETFRLLEARPHLVTYNGASFDWPFLKTRAVYHRMGGIPELHHVDLLKHARRHWRGTFEDCKLQTLEWKVVGRRRVGDVLGSEIPGRYHRFVQDQDPWPLAPVFHHNLLDLVAMADLLVEMLELEAGA